MTTENQNNNRNEIAPFVTEESYNAAVQLHNQEFRTLGERNNVFITAQSILITAFVFIAIYREKFPEAFTIIAIGVSIVGIMFCLINYLAGKSGSQAAFMWRRYMRWIEGQRSNTPWSWFYSHCEHTHNVERHRNLISRMLCERCLLDRSPLPHAWLYVPAVFAGIWSVAISYIIPRWFLAKELHQITTRYIPTALGITIFITVLLVRAWWQNR